MRGVRDFSRGVKDGFKDFRFNKYKGTVVIYWDGKDSGYRRFSRENPNTYWIFQKRLETVGCISLELKEESGLETYTRDGPALTPGEHVLVDRRSDTWELKMRRSQRERLKKRGEGDRRKTKWEGVWVATGDRFRGRNNQFCQTWHIGQNNMNENWPLELAIRRSLVILLRAT